MDRLGPGRCARQQPLPRRLPEPRPEAQTQRFAEQIGRHRFEQRASEPVRLDDPPVERVRDRVRAGDELQVRVGALEAERELAQLALVAAIARLAEDGLGVVRPAQPEPVRAVRVAGEEDRTGRLGSGTGQPSEGCAGCIEPTGTRRVAATTSATATTMRR